MERRRRSIDDRSDDGIGWRAGDWPPPGQSHHVEPSGAHTHTHTHVGVSLFAFRNFDIVFLGFDHLTAIVMQSHMICFVNEIGSMTIDL